VRSDHPLTSPEAVSNDVVWNCR